MQRKSGRLLKGIGSLAGAFMLLPFCVNAEDIGKIEIVLTGHAVKPEAIEQIVHSSIGSKVGEPLSPATVSEDIRRLIKSGKLDDVKVSHELGADGKVVLTYSVKPKPVIASITIEGNEKYTDKKLMKLVESKAGNQLDEKLLANDRKAILKRYHDGGYYGTEVISERHAAEDGSVNIVLKVTEEERFKLKKVYFENNSIFTESELRSAIVTRRQWWRYILRFGNYYNKEQVMLDKDKLQQMYASKGYMDFAVSDIRREVLDNGKWVKVTFVLDEGRPYKISSIDIDGQQKYSAEELLKKTKLAVGDIHNSIQEDADIEAMKSDYEKLGYIDMRLWATHEKNYDNATVAVKYHVSEGNPARIRNIDITGNTATKDEVIRRELSIMPGDLGDNSKIRASKRRLLNMGYFETVDILPVSTDVPDLRDLHIDLDEKSTGKIMFGAGYSTEDNVAAFAEFTETNFDLGRMLGLKWPPQGDGQKLNARFQLGSEVSNVIITHTEPWFLDRRLSLTTDLFFRNRFEDEYDQRNVGVGQMISWPVAFKLPGTDHVENWSMGVGYRAEYVKIDDVDRHDPEKAMTKGDFVRGHILADEEDGYTVSRLVLQLSRDTRNSFFFPSRGSRFDLRGEFITEALGSYETYGRFDAEITKYIPAFRDFVLKLNADYCSTTGDESAIFDRYFAGGVGTVRGFRRRDVAPVDCFEDPLGGNSMFTATAELIKPVSDFMFVSVFVDAGNVWWDEFDLELGDLNYSVGAGVQFRTLPISIYYGYPVSTTYDHLEGRHGRVHFNVGINY